MLDRSQLGYAILGVASLLLTSLLTTIWPGPAEAEDNQMSTVEIQSLADGKRLPFAEVETESKIAAAVMRSLETCPSAVWTSDGLDNANAQNLERLMRAYNGKSTVQRHWEDGSYPACWNEVSLTSALVDDVLFVSESSDGTYILDTVRMDNIANHVLVDALFAYNEATNHDGAYRKIISPLELDNSTDFVTNDDDGFTSSDYAETKELFGSWHEEGDDYRFRREDVRAMYEVGYWKRTAAAHLNGFPFSTEAHKTHYSSWWSSLWANVKYISQPRLNKIIGLLEDVSGNSDSPQVHFHLSGETEWSEDNENGIGQMAVSFLEREIVHLPIVQNMLNGIADTIVFNPAIDQVGRTYAEELRVEATEDGDPLAILFFIRASAKHSDDLFDYVEGIAHNTDLLTNATIGNEFAGLATDALEEILDNAWEAGESLDNSGDAANAATATAEVNQVATEAVYSTGSGRLADDTLAQHLGSEEGSERMSYALELGFSAKGWDSILAQALGIKIDFVDKWTSRMFFTHPRLVGNNQYLSEFRIRLYDEVGVTGNANIPGGHIQATTAFKGVHDLIFPIYMNSDMGNASTGSLVWRNSYTALIKADANATRSFIRDTAAQVAPVIGGDEAETPAVTAVSSAITTGEVTLAMIADSFKSGDIEVGGAYGVSFTYDVAKMRQEAAWGILVGPLLWAVGTAGGAYLTDEFVAPYVTTHMGLHAGFSAIHFGADIGTALGDLAALGLINGMSGNHDLVALHRGGVVWAAVRPVKLKLSSAFFLRARFQYEVFFHSTEIL